MGRPGSLKWFGLYSQPDLEVKTLSQMKHKL